MTATELKALIEMLFPNDTGKNRPPYPPLVLVDLIREECAKLYGDSDWREVWEFIIDEAEREAEDNDGHRGVGA